MSDTGWDFGAAPCSLPEEPEQSELFFGKHRAKQPRGLHRHHTQKQLGAEEPSGSHHLDEKRTHPST